ncbi:hypothetical protein [Ancylobacter amanitiformis]|uniref:hypothetical protein n=1 Tax=Ancylobacter amanitiformis TaxID=217069 RepID=UPI003522B925
MVQRVVITGATDYRRFQAAAMKQRYSIRFPDLLDQSSRPRGLNRFCREEDGSLPDPDLASAALDAPPQLAEEMADLIRFKTATLTAFGYQRNGVCGEETASQKVEHLGLVFGALAASPSGAVHGFGVPLENLSFSLLVFPIVWDWYILWRKRRRGFYTAWEVNMMRIASALTRAETGWLRQNPHLGERIRPITNLITERDISAAHADWDAACEQMHRHGLARAREIQRVARIHRDPFEPIIAVLEAESPVAEYRKITEKILRLMPDEKRNSVTARTRWAVDIGTCLPFKSPGGMPALVWSRHSAFACEVAVALPRRYGFRPMDLHEKLLNAAIYGEAEATQVAMRR